MDVVIPNEIPQVFLEVFHYPALEATHRKAVGLGVQVPVDTSVARVQVMVPSCSTTCNR